MFETLVDVFLDALIDSLKILPFLFGVYLLIEYIEHRSADKLGKALRKMGPFGAIAAVRIFRCGFQPLLRQAHHNGNSHFGIPCHKRRGNTNDDSKPCICRQALAAYSYKGSCGYNSRCAC